MATTKSKARTTKSKPTKAKATKAQSNGKATVTFTEAIPKVTREGGGSRKSKYDELLDTLVERYENDESATARMVFDSVGKSTSRYQSIKSAIEKREDAACFDVAQRTEGEDVCAVYVQYNPALATQESDDGEA